MAWIESHQALGRHPKTRKAARLAGVSVVTMVGHLHFLWWWSLDFAQDGDLARYDDDEIAEAAAWEGDPEGFVAALLAAGFIDEGRALHDWDDYAGKLVEQRRANADRQKRHRERHKDVTSQPPAEPVTVTSPSRNGATVPNPTVPNRTEQDRTRAGGAAAPDARKRATRLPQDFPLTDERRALIRRERPDLDPEWFHDEFCSYWRGSGQPKVDWDQTYRNGLLKAKGPPRAVRDRADPTAMPARTARNIRILQESD